MTSWKNVHSPRQVFSPRSRPSTNWQPAEISGRNYKEKISKKQKKTSFPTFQSSIHVWNFILFYFIFFPVGSANVGAIGNRNEESLTNCFKSCRKIVSPHCVQAANHVSGVSSSYTCILCVWPRKIERKRSGQIKRKALGHPPADCIFGILLSSHHHFSQEYWN